MMRCMINHENTTEDTIERWFFVKILVKTGQKGKLKTLTVKRLIEFVNVYTRSVRVHGPNVSCDM